MSGLDVHCRIYRYKPSKLQTNIFLTLLYLWWCRHPRVPYMCRTVWPAEDPVPAHLFYRYHWRGVNNSENRGLIDSQVLTVQSLGKVASLLHHVCPFVTQSVKPVIKHVIVSKKAGLPKNRIISASQHWNFISLQLCLSAVDQRLSWWICFGVQKLPKYFLL